MTEIEISILNRSYKIACTDGDENRVEQFAQDLDEQMQALQTKLPNVSDINLFVINSLITLDKLATTPTQSTPTPPPENDAETIAEFEKITNRLEIVAQKIKNL